MILTSRLVWECCNAGRHCDTSGFRWQSKVAFYNVIGWWKQTFAKNETEPRPSITPVCLEMLKRQLGAWLFPSHYFSFNSKQQFSLCFIFLNQLIGVQHVSENYQLGLFIYLYSKWPGGGKKKKKNRYFVLFGSFAGGWLSSLCQSSWSGVNATHTTALGPLVGFESCLFF